MRIRLATIALCVAACGRPSDTPVHAEREPFVVAIVVDQLSAWVADERLPLLPPDGFFARLAREGTWVHAMRYPYAQTDTGPGHAALHTGRVPAESGIVLNELPVEKSMKRMSVFRDESTKLVGPDGVRDRAGSSAARLLVPTVADRLRAARPDARVLSVSLKDRAALLPAGKKPSHAIWFDATEGSFVTSTAIEASFPAWAAPSGDARAIAQARAKTWTPLDAAWLAAHAGKDDAPGEGDLDGFGTTFPHVAKSNASFRATPAADEAILSIALAGVAAEHDPKKPFLLLLSMSTSDVIGHLFGPSSWEAWDQLRRLDAALSRFLDALEAKVGRVDVVLSGDHGNLAMPEARVPYPSSCVDPLERPLCKGGARLMPEKLRDDIEDAVDGVLGAGDWIAGVSDGYVFLTSAARALDADAQKKLYGAMLEALMRGHGKEIQAVIDTRDLARTCPEVIAKARKAPDRARAGEDMLTLVCRSFRADAGGGELYIVPKHGSFFDGEIVPGKGSSHGTPFLHDRTVPLLVRGRGADAGSTMEDPVDFTAYSEIEASFLGLSKRPPREIIDLLRAR